MPIIAYGNRRMGYKGQKYSEYTMTNSQKQSQSQSQEASTSYKYVMQARAEERKARRELEEKVRSALARQDKLPVRQLETIVEAREEIVRKAERLEGRREMQNRLEAEMRQE